MSGELLMSGQLFGRITGLKNRDWSLFYLEVSSTHFHIFEGHEDLSAARKHLRSLEINSTDVVEKDRGSLRFTLKRRGDGNYTFRCDNEQNREKWTISLERLINKRQFERLPGYRTPSQEGIIPTELRPEVPKKVDIPKVPKAPQKYSVLEHPLPPVPVSTDSGSGSGSDNSGSGTFNISNRMSKASVKSDDSGFGASGSGQIFRQPRHFSGDGTHKRPPIQVKQTSTSDGGKFGSREELQNYKWFWGPMNRPDSEKKMKAEGVMGNFAIRINTSGCYVMTFWRSDAIHHHKIIRQCGIYRFEKTAVSAEGDSLVDLLDNYMTKCTDKKIVPFGGVLHLVYDEPWNPPDIDMTDLERKLKEKKKIEDRQKVLMDSITPKKVPENPRRKEDKRKDEYTVVSPTIENELTESLPGPTFKVMKESAMKIPNVHSKQVTSPSDPAIDRRNNPLPPTPVSVSTPKQSSPGHSPNRRKNAPAAAPRKTPSSPTIANLPSLDSSENVYENTTFGGHIDIKKKSPIHEPKRSPSPVAPKKSYQNVGFGDSGGEALYANVSRPVTKTAKPPVSARKGLKDRGKRPDNGKEENSHIQVSNGNNWPPPYQNVDYSDKNPSQNMYQNIVHPRRTVT